MAGHDLAIAPGLAVSAGRGKSVGDCDQLQSGAGGQQPQAHRLALALSALGVALTNVCDLLCVDPILLGGSFE
ncbi:hypothetical protein [Glycomyces sp. YM15]|uniref:hypothetical protein n=1 Tax=Glycomyces sp. YM15 TaxID=2800446 RepID=UPI001962B289|nr:hypothetical protein [Glycomyces sp. YM15]